MKTTEKYQKQTRVMKEAWVMFREYDGELSFRECLGTAWNLERGIITNGITKDADVQTIKEVVYMNENSTDWMNILITVKNNSRGFQKDIATKALNGMNISEKQAWCVAYEFKNVA